MREAAVLRARPGARIESPLCRLSQDLAGLVGWRRYGIAFLLGVLLAGTMSPVDLTPLLWVAFPGLLWIDRGSASAGASFRLGYVFALGFFIAGLYWIAGAFFVDIDEFWWLVPFAVVGLPALLALWPALALYLTSRAVRRLGLGPAARICLFAVAWSATAWGRGHALTGFPWNLVGYAWAGGFPGAIAMLESTAWIGIYGLTFLTVLAASLPSLLGTPSLVPIPPWQRRAPAIATLLLILVPAGAGAVRLATTPTVLTPTWLRLVQPSIPQSLKWDPRAVEAGFQRLIELSAAPAPHSLAAIIWPEAAVTFLLDRDAAHRTRIAAVAPPGGYVITGALRANPPPAPPTTIWNSLLVIDRTGDILAHYDKAHLVPFGEYVPFHSFLPIRKITAGRIDLTPGPGPRTLAVPHLPPFGPFICYEAIFPGAVVDSARRPDWLLNVTDDAWYGRSSGPYQHFAIARTRAVEEGLPLVRDANNGISGVVDAEGRVLARTRLDDVGYADVELPAPGARTLYARGGDWIFLGLLVCGLVPVALGRRPASRPGHQSAGNPEL
jgi:apolipoprotein N-acyltransferase